MHDAYVAKLSQGGKCIWALTHGTSFEDGGSHVRMSESGVRPFQGSTPDSAFVIVAFLTDAIRALGSSSARDDLCWPCVRIPQQSIRCTRRPCRSLHRNGNAHDHTDLVGALLSHALVWRSERRRRSRACRSDRVDRSHCHWLFCRSSSRTRICAASTSDGDSNCLSLHSDRTLLVPFRVGLVRSRVAGFQSGHSTHHVTHCEHSRRAAFRSTAAIEPTATRRLRWPAWRRCAAWCATRHRRQGGTTRHVEASKEAEMKRQERRSHDRATVNRISVALLVDTMDQSRNTEGVGAMNATRGSGFERTRRGRASRCPT